VNIDLAPVVRIFPDFPTPGIAFQDLAPLYETPGLLKRLGETLAGSFPQGFEVVLAVEARGFVIGTAVATATGRPLILARKQGKLPGPLHRAEYDLEYGSAVLTIQHGAVATGAKVLVVDDVLATGGTLAAAARLVEEAGGTVSGFGVLLDLEALGGRARLAPVPVVSLLTSS
jgi:adenine phosphoribosyltransferase